MSRRRKKSTPAPVARVDGFTNVLSGIGTSRDPSYFNRYLLDTLHPDDAQTLWRSNPVAAKVVEMRPMHAFREGFEIVTGDPELSKEIREALEDIPCGDTKGVSAAMALAGKYENAYGGAIIFPVILDGGDLSQPLRTTGRMPRIECLHVLDPRDLVPASYYRSILEPKFGLPRTWRLHVRSRGGMHAAGQVIHESRLIVFPGIMCSRDQVSACTGFGDSRLARVDVALAQSGMAWAGVASLMHRIEQGVLSMQGLRGMLGTDQDKTVTKALSNIDSLRSLINMLVIDKEDTYQRLGVPLAGVSDVLEKLMLNLAGAAGIPASFLWGMAPAGLNATGDADTRSFYDSVALEQTDHYQPRLEQLIRLYMLTNESVTGGKEPDSWSIEWRSLWQPTDKEIAEANDIQASADDKNIANGTLTPTIVRRNRFGSGKQSFATTVTEQEMRELEELNQAATEAQIKALEDPPAPAEPEPETEPEPKDD